MTLQKMQQTDGRLGTAPRLALPPPHAGAVYCPGALAPQMQQNLLEAVRKIIAAAPLFTPVMPRTGKPFSVRMTNCGALGWVSDRAGYRYQPTHPKTGRFWPEMPALLLSAWRDLGGTDVPQACLINYYAADARMSLHQDRDEEDFAAPVVSLSLGDTALFRIGGTHRAGKTKSFRLASGDGFVLGGAARLAFHGVDHILPGTSTLLEEGGRFNLTLRRVTRM